MARNVSLPKVLGHLWDGIKRIVSLGKSVRSAYRSIKRNTESVIESIDDVRKDLHPGESDDAEKTDELEKAA